MAKQRNVAYSGAMDDIDVRIIGHLRENSRAPFQDIGSSVGLSASAVKRRVDRLIRDGVIRGFTIEVDPTVDGLAVEAWVELYCRGTVAPKDLKRILSGVPEVVQAGTVSGDADAVAYMRATDIRALEDALERVRLAPNVNHTKSSIVLSQLIDRPRL
jgi:DNA-binding Lrp family transcriptional regulator